MREGPRLSTGFTLVEMLVVLAVVGLVLTTATWAMKPIRDRGLVLRAIASFKALAEMARERALRSGEIVGLSIDIRDRRVSIAGTNHSERFADGIDLTWISAKATAGQLSSGQDDGAILFLPDGTSSGGRFSVRRGEVGAAVRISWLSGAAVDEH